LLKRISAENKLKILIRGSVTAWLHRISQSMQEKFVHFAMVFVIHTAIHIWEY